MRLQFTKELGVNNRAIPGVNVVYADSSSRVHARQSNILNVDRGSHKKVPCPCTQYSGLRISNKSVHRSDLTQARAIRHSGSMPKKAGLKRT